MRNTVLAVTLLALAACSSEPAAPAPVETDVTPAATPAAAPAPADTEQTGLTLSPSLGETSVSVQTTELVPTSTGTTTTVSGPATGTVTESSGSVSGTSH
jgi:hypothetical protein